MNQLLADLLAALKRLQDALLEYLPTPPDPVDVYGEKMYLESYKVLGDDVSPDDVAEDNLGCMESVSMIVRKARPDIKFPIILSTIKGYEYFSKSPHFRRIYKLKKGAIIINVTGTGNGKVSNGHVGICGMRTAPDGSVWIMSNNSWTGRWDAFYTEKTWNKYYRDLGGMETHLFESI